MKRQQFTATDEARCEATISWGKGETAQCRRSKRTGHYCRQHAQIAAERVAAGRKVIENMKAGR